MILTALTQVLITVLYRFPSSTHVPHCSVNPPHCAVHTRYATQSPWRNSRAATRRQHNPRCDTTQYSCSPLALYATYALLEYSTLFQSLFLESNDYLSLFREGAGIAATLVVWCQRLRGSPRLGIAAFCYNNNNTETLLIRIIIAPRSRIFWSACFMSNYSKILICPALGPPSCFTRDDNIYASLSQTV